MEPPLTPQKRGLQCLPGLGYHRAELASPIKCLACGRYPDDAEVSCSTTVRLLGSGQHTGSECYGHQAPDGAGPSVPGGGAPRLKPAGLTHRSCVWEGGWSDRRPARDEPGAEGAGAGSPGGWPRGQASRLHPESATALRPLSGDGQREPQPGAPGTKSAEPEGAQPAARPPPAGGRGDARGGAPPPSLVGWRRAHLTGVASPALAGPCFRSRRGWPSRPEPGRTGRQRAAAAADTQ